jgi:hypothetical protein
MRNSVKIKQNGTTTSCITALNIMTLIISTISKMALSIMTLNTKTAA